MRSFSRLRRSAVFGAVLAALLAPGFAVAQSASRNAVAPTPSAPAPDSSAFARRSSSLRFRSIGPALTSGRIADVVVDSDDLPQPDTSACRPECQTLTGVRG